MNVASSIRHLLTLTTVALPIGILSQPVEARTVAAAVGAVNNSDAGCVSLWFGTVTNICNDRTLSFDWPLPVDSGGNKAVGVIAFAATSSNNVGCLAEGLNAEATTVSYSNGGAYRFLPAFGSAQNISLVGAFVPGGGQLIVNCRISPGGRIQVAGWPG